MRLIVLSGSVDKPQRGYGCKGERSLALRQQYLNPERKFQVNTA